MLGDAALLLEFSEHSLDEIAIFVATIVGMFGRFPVCVRRDDRQDAPSEQALAEAVAVIARVRQLLF